MFFCPHSKTIHLWDSQLHPKLVYLEGEVDMEEVARWLALIGSGMALQHRLSYGKWHDRGKLICHGKAGLALTGLGLIYLLV